ncbi:MAG: 2-amino-4-hydroxy-6-hydroxymethyldihydropteridine diphosphokinase [Nannocystis sp.]|uniref:2-amino-4-hydroxy-6- hydroxymethyldihydropteridine diphosphokinase n=1 Tax=Nannocystis sp. TaxID=1962667 RepID=UPI002429E12F|nr:2-amino-4-hydroxy-6-hydroxymethyldihydropteridine diphosphokinase [Nannocystis sp.]MBK9753248.1 2-amino-4-hydroxy-6-hydroxymethyldihydropteridine diphosphokinase [Nannocystis sp.]
MYAEPRRSSLTGAGVAAATVYVGLGSNLGDRLATLQGAARQLRDGVVPGTVLVRSSPVYETRPLGPSTAEYMNAVVELRTVVEPAALLSALQGLELLHGRTRRTRWEARTLDLDILMWLPIGLPSGLPSGLPIGLQGLLLDTPGLRLPHAELERRDFVLAPLAALAPGLRPRGGASVAELLAALNAADRTIVAQVAEHLC